MGESNAKHDTDSTRTPDAASPETMKRQPGGNVRAFLDRLYWIIGTFCIAWSASAIVGILRRRALDLPILGETEITETIVFTLLGFSILVPLLLYVVATWRGVARCRRWRTRFPGAASDEWEIPRSFAWLRMLLFVALVGGPIATMQLCYQRMLTLEIRWNGDGEAVILSQKNAPGRTLFDFPPQPAPDNEYSNWRWIGIDSVDAKSRSKITAAPGFMPWGFRLVSYGSIAVGLWFVAAPAGTLRRWLKPRG